MIKFYLKDPSPNTSSLVVKKVIGFMHLDHILYKSVKDNNIIASIGIPNAYQYIRLPKNI